MHDSKTVALHEEMPYTKYFFLSLLPLAKLDILTKSKNGSKCLIICKRLLSQLSRIPLCDKATLGEEGNQLYPSYAEYYCLFRSLLRCRQRSC